LIGPVPQPSSPLGGAITYNHGGITMTTDTTEQQTGPRAEVEQQAPASGNGRPRVVILGGGVAGLTAAYELRRRLRDRVEITLISDSDRFLLGLSLIWTPLGPRPLTFPLTPALQKHASHFVHARVSRISPARQAVLAQY